MNVHRTFISKNFRYRILYVQDYPACFNRLKYNPVIQLSSKFGIPCEGVSVQTKCFILSVKIQSKLPKGQAASSD